MYFKEMKRGEKMKGLTFEMKNEYGKKQVDILVDIVEPSWYWSIGPGESYKREKGGLGPAFFPPNSIIDGQSFLNLISSEEYYLIFADLKAFPTQESVVEVNNHEDFLKSSCQLALLVIDSNYVSIILKEQQMVHKFFERAKSAGYTNIKFLTDENEVDSLFTVWGS